MSHILLRIDTIFYLFTKVELFIRRCYNDCEVYKLFYDFMQNMINKYIYYCVLENDYKIIGHWVFSNNFNKGFIIELYRQWSRLLLILTDILFILV